MKPCFTKHPIFNRYLISDNGLVWDSLKNQEAPYSLNSSEYKHVTIYDNDNKRHWVPVHKLVAETYVPRPERYGVAQKLSVNHKNGIKEDNRSDNLEWCMIQENQRHAGLNGLTPKFLPIEIRLVATNEVKKFDSFVECAQYLGISKDAVSWRVKRGPEMVHDGYQFRRSLGYVGLKWPEPVGKDVAVRDLQTNSTHLFSTSREVAEFTKSSEVTIWNWLRRKGQPVLNNRYQVQWLHGLVPWRNPSKEEIELGRKRRVLPVKLVNPVTGEIRIYASGRECAKDMGLKPSNLLHRLKNTHGKIHPDGFVYSYHSHSKE